MAGGTKARVLVVDDEASIRLLCRINLELDGYEVVEAATIAEAREALAASPVDLVLLDLHLGTQTTHVLVAECAARTPRVPVALLTGSAGDRQARDAGADALLPKPFDVERLAETVRRLTSTTAR